MKHRIAPMLLVLSALGLGCEQQLAPVTVDLTWTADTSAASTHLVLSHAPTALAQQSGIRELASDLELTGTDGGFGYVRDVTTITNGIVVLDALTREVTFYSSSGELRGRLGRRGKGPGEFSNPLALAAVDSIVVVWDSEPTRAFTMIGIQGARVVATAPAQIDGDWNPGIRGRHDITAPSSINTNWEDMTRRLGPAGPGHFVHQIQRNERAVLGTPDTSWFATPPSYLIRYSIAGEITDTLSTLQAPPTIRTTLPTDRQGRPMGRERFIVQELYPSRPLWAATHDWIALAHGGNARFSILKLGERDDTIVSIAWPSSSRELGEEDHLRHLQWIFEEGPKFGHDIPPDYPRSARKRREYFAKILPELRSKHPLARYSPEVTALYAGGNCVWVTGFSLEDHADGTALTLLGIDVQTRGVLGAVRIPHRGARIRHASASAIFTVESDRDGVHTVRRYPHGYSRCGS